MGDAFPQARITISVPQHISAVTEAAAKSELQAVRACALADEARLAHGDVSMQRYAANAGLLGEVFGCLPPQGSAKVSETQRPRPQRN
ncbi:hypothetical protein WJX81_008702 [Elliptochloris bilobata]|uniref:Uncharacterized protein n=1 Tax=Elliptochloris bilobata TaxID=381761 RepID=A0AAW1R155_9CHLO